MAQFRFRPLESLEDRATPAALWAVGIQNARANEGLVKQVAEYLVATGNTQANPFRPVGIDPATRDYLAKVVAQSEAGVEHMKDLRLAARQRIARNPALAESMAGYLRTAGGLQFQLQGIAAVARRIGAIVGTNFAPTTPPTPTTRPDAGLVNTIPDVTSANFVDQGNGLKIWDTKVGTGAVVAAGSNVQIFYTGWLLNGTRFDSKRSPAAPANFALTDLIEGWQQGIPGMRVGGIRRLYIPADQAYGAAGRPNATPPIPANADLVFEIKVVGTTP